MVSKVLSLLFMLFMGLQVSAQHLIGLSKEQVQQEVKKSFSDYLPDNSSINTTYNYLKFINKFEERTLLVFFSEKDTCTSTKMICDYASISELVEELNRKNTPAGKDQWIFSYKGVVYMIRLKREDWFFTVYTTKK